MAAVPSACWFALLLRAFTTLLCFSNWALGHEQTRAKNDATGQAADRQADVISKQASDQNGDFANLTIELWDREKAQPVPGLIKVTNVATGKAIELAGVIHRKANWYSVPPKIELQVPHAKLRVDAFHGIETQLVSREIDFTARNEATLIFKLPRIYDPRARGDISGNTHLHLMKLSYKSAMRYLDLVPKSDGLDVVFLSYLRRIPDERTYISNLIVENSFNGGDLDSLSRQGTIFGNGEEHRHNFQDREDSEGYGHVMFLNLKKLLHPVSIGPKIMRTGTDGTPVQQGIRQARSDGATVIWCHGRFGLEDVPNWVEGLLHAQNIFDGGSHGGYEDSFYKYLNLGLKVPFSTGTDWFIYDFSRVYVPIQGVRTIDRWLQQLRTGRSYITNGTFLEFAVNDRQIGDTLSLESPSSVKVQGRAVGRNNFGSLELIFNGKVVDAVNSHDDGGHFKAEMDFDFRVTEPGWLALRIPRHVAKNELDKELFAHTSPIYLEVAGQQIFQPHVARRLVEEIEQNLGIISTSGIFGPGEEAKVLQVHRRAIVGLNQLITDHRSDRQSDLPSE